MNNCSSITLFISTLAASTMFLMVMIVALLASANACHNVRRAGASWGYPNHKNSGSVLCLKRNLNVVFSICYTSCTTALFTFLFI
jgi:hypothetical protein